MEENDIDLILGANTEIFSSSMNAPLNPTVSIPCGTYDYKKLTNCFYLLSLLQSDLTIKPRCLPHILWNSRESLKEYCLLRRLKHLHLHPVFAIQKVTSL